MKVEIFPSAASGKIPAPPSKSMGHRLLISAGLSAGESVVHGIAPSEDMYATMDCLTALGAKIEYDGTDARVCGIDIDDIPDGAVLACRECGSTLRFFVPIALLSGKRITLTGTEKLFSRPMSVYEKLCGDAGFEYKIEKASLSVCGRLCGGEYSIPGNVSSQFISGLIFALPLAKKGSRIKIIPPLESRPYVDMTLEAVREFGIEAHFTDEYTIDISCGAYRAHECTVEGDWSNAAFFSAFNLIGGDVQLTGLRSDSLQGDKVYREIFEKLKHGGSVIDLSDCPDLGPVSMAMAAELGGADFVGTARLRIKESDRCACVAKELAKFGCRCEIYEDSMKILPSKLHTPSEVLSSHNDHRIAMSLSLLSSIYGGIIDGAEAVRKSLPDFFRRIEKLGVKVDYDGMVK